MKKTGFLKAAAPVLLLFPLILVLSCAETDVVAKIAKTSFAAMLDASKDRPIFSEKDSSWVLRSPGGDTFFFPTGLSGNPDFRFSFDAGPFIAAGLDPSGLPVGGRSGLRRRRQQTRSPFRPLARRLFRLRPGSPRTRPSTLLSM